MHLVVPKRRSLEGGKVIVGINRNARPDRNGGASRHVRAEENIQAFDVGNELLSPFGMVQEVIRVAVNQGLDFEVPGESLVVVIDIEQHAKPDLLDVAEARDGTRLLARLGE